jgi:hypothetical protein
MWSDQIWTFLARCRTCRAVPRPYSGPERSRECPHRTALRADKAVCHALGSLSLPFGYRHWTWAEGANSRPLCLTKRRGSPRHKRSPHGWGRTLYLRPRAGQGRQSRGPWPDWDRWASGCSQGDNDPASWPARFNVAANGEIALAIAAGSVIIEHASRPLPGCRRCREPTLALSPLSRRAAGNKTRMTSPSERRGRWLGS